MNTLLTPRSLVAPLLILFFAVVTLPLIGLAFYNHPAIADDYCFADTAIKYGFWQAQRFYYDGWTGRYFHNFVVHANPLVWHWNAGYQVFPVLMMGLIWASGYWLIRQLAPSVLSVREQGVASLGLALVSITSLVSVAEFFYWYAGLACYSFSWVFMVMLIGLLIRHDREGFNPSGLLVVEALLVLAIVGSSEVSMVLVMSFLAMLALCQLLYRRKIPLVTILLLLIGLVGCYYLFTAPGNAIRIGGNPNSRNIAFSLKETFRFSLAYFPRQLFTSTLLPITLLFLPIAYRLTNVDNPTRRYFQVHPLLTLSYWLGLLFVLTMLHYWGVGIPPIARILNMVNLVLAFGWLYHVVQGVLWLRPLINRSLFMTDYRWLTVALGTVWLVGTLLIHPALRLAWNDLLSGRAKAYDQDMRRRYEQMRTSPSEPVQLPPLSAAPVSLFTEDISTNPDYLWNRCWSSYYHRKSTRLSQSRN